MICPRCDGQQYDRGSCSLCGNVGYLDEHGQRIAAAEVCPECKGAGGGERVLHAQVCGTIEDDEARDQFHNLHCHVEPWTCRACGGSGRLIGLARAIYMARGGLPPVQTRGFA